MDTLPSDDLSADDLSGPDPLVPRDEPEYSNSEPGAPAADFAVTEAPVATAPAEAPPIPPAPVASPVSLADPAVVPAESAPPSPAPVDFDGDGIITLEEVSFQNEAARQNLPVGSAPEGPAEPAADPVATDPEPGEPIAEAPGPEAPLPGRGTIPEPEPVPAPEPVDMAELALQQAIRRRQHLEALIAAQTLPDAPPPSPVQVITHVVHAEPDPVNVAPAAAPIAAPPVAPIPAPSHLDLDATATFLRAVGIQTEHVHGSTIAELREAIEDGRSVVLAIDADELKGLRDDGSPLDTGADRAAVVTGIDVDRGIAYVFLPPDGETMEVSLEDLRAAWDDSDNEMLIAGRADPKNEKDDTRQPIQLERASDSGWSDALVLLPVTLGGIAAVGGTRVLRSVRRRPGGGTTNPNDD